LQAQSRDAVLLRGEHPAGREPHGERRPPTIEQSACRYRGPGAARPALVAVIRETPPAGLSAPRTDEAVGPAQPVQVVQAVGIGRKPGLELSRRPGVVPSRSGLELIHATRLVRSDEYPQAAYRSPVPAWDRKRPARARRTSRPPLRLCSLSLPPALVAPRERNRLRLLKATVNFS
jgi:hypothetical protein